MNEPATEGTGIPGKPGTSTPAFERALHLFSVFHLKITSFSAAKKVNAKFFDMLTIRISVL